MRCKPVNDTNVMCESKFRYTSEERQRQREKYKPIVVLFAWRVDFSLAFIRVHECISRFSYPEYDDRVWPIHAQCRFVRAEQRLVSYPRIRMAVSHFDGFTNSQYSHYTRRQCVETQRHEHSLAWRCGSTNLYFRLPLALLFFLSFSRILLFFFADFVISIRLRQRSVYSFCTIHLIVLSIDAEFCDWLYVRS